jgi:hypothetical protein
MEYPSPSLPTGYGLRGVLVVGPVFVFSVRHGFTDVVRELSQSVFLDAFAKLRKRDYLLSHTCLFVCPRGTTWLPLDGNFTKFGI